ncbi:integrase catalytic domain-containing protein [Trichonephila clavipes]|nr:integrase catalytic domain-containing protein [Trichonephila clavipes]
MNQSLQVFCDASKSSYAIQDFRLPITLPSNHPVVKALIIYKHVQLGHAGVQMLIYTLRESYWILKGRKPLKKSLRLALFASDSMRNLYRYQEDSYLKTGRFIARRGRPSVIYSDNGTNSKGDYRFYQKVNLEKLKNVEKLNPISWKFIPPRVPWWGGFWERLIGLVKRTLRKTLGKTSLNHDEMYMVLCDCESLINSRPLTYVTDDVEDLEPLTPAMFLQDIREVGAPELDQIDENKLNKRLVYRNRIQNDLRKRFRVEYLGQLRETRNIKGENTLSEGDIVLVGDDHTKRLNWNLVQKLYLLEVMEKNKSSVHPTNSPLFSDANEGSHLPINIDPELSKPQRAATSSMQPCSSISNGGAGLEPRAETRGHQQAETSSMQTCSSVSDVEAGVKPRLETLELPDVLTSDGELQQPGPRRSRYGRLLKPRKGLNDYC